MSRYPILILFSLVLLSSCARKGMVSSLGEGNTLRLGPVITIHTEGGYRAPCEPSIAISKSNADVMVAGSVLNNVYVSTDAGHTWRKSRLISRYGVYGDPVIRSNSDGSFLYSHLSLPGGRAYESDSFLDRIVVQRSDSGETDWSVGSFPPCDTTKDHDKQWLCTGNNGLVLMSWTEFDKYGLQSDTCHSRILFSKSIDGGVNWDTSKIISNLEGDCVDDDQTAEGAHPCIGADGAYYVVWGRDGVIWLNRSDDGGATWFTQEKEIASQVGGWSMSIPGLERCNGMPVMKCDLSGGVFHGRLYVLWADQKNGTEDTDIWLIFSDNRGESWSNPVMVNDGPAGKHQFFPWMDIDQETGKLYVIFYDRRGGSGTKTHTYLAVSEPGGTFFKNIRLSKKPFIQKKGAFFGDYNDISVFQGKIRPIWTWQEGDLQSIQTMIIDEIQVK